MGVFDERVPVAQPGQPNPGAQQLSPFEMFKQNMVKAVAMAQAAKQNGSAGGMITPPIIGAVPTMAPPPVAPTSMGGTSAPARPMSPAMGPSNMRDAGPIAMPTVNQPRAMAPPTPPGYMTGYEFGTPAGRNAAIATGAIGSVMEAVSKFKQQKTDKERATAENYMNQIVAAQNSGDQETLNLLLSDPKVIKTLEKGLNYIMPKRPGEPPPPEAQGIQGALKKAQAAQQQNGRLPAPNTPGGVAIPQVSQAAQAMKQLGDMIAQERLRKAQQDPKYLESLATGTTLSGDQMNKAEAYQSGLELTPMQKAQLTTEDQKMYTSTAMQLTELDAQNRNLIAKLASDEKQQKIAAGPLYARVAIWRKTLGRSPL
jgi:hypothetical protein